jgi:hypothetical protein
MSFYNLYDAITYQSDPIESLSFKKFKEIQDYNTLDMVLFNSGASYLFKSRYSMYFPEKPNLYTSRLSHLYIMRYFINTNVYPFDYLRFKNRFSPLKIFINEFLNGLFVGNVMGITEYLFLNTKSRDISYIVVNSEKSFSQSALNFIFSRGIHAGLSWGLYFSLSTCLYHQISFELIFKKFGISFLSNFVACLVSFPIYFFSIHINYFKPSNNRLKINDVIRDTRLMFQKRDPFLQAGLLYVIEHIIIGTIYLSWIDFLYFI